MSNRIIQSILKAITYSTLYFFSQSTSAKQQRIHIETGGQQDEQSVTHCCVYQASAGQS
jgi:hypothetical protein